MAKSNTVDSYIDTVGEYFDRLPALPRNAKEVVVSIVPWLALIFGIIGIALSIVSFGIFSFLSPVLLLTGSKTAGSGIILVLLSLVSSIFLLLGFPGTQKRQEKGWKWVFYSEVVSLIADIVTISLSGIVLSLIGFYFLYQIRKLYK
jgi:amino acid transporter